MNKFWVGTMMLVLGASPLAAQDAEIKAIAEKVINVNDADKDGKVSLDESITRVRQFVKELVAAGTDEAKTKAVHEKFNMTMNATDFACSDTDGDKVVTKDEVAVWLKANNDGVEVKLTKLAQVEAAAVLEFFQSGIDKNDDEKITKDEAGEAWNTLKPYDTNSDSNVTKDEYCAKRLTEMKEFYGIKESPKDPKDPKAGGEGELNKEAFALYTKKGRTWTMKITSKTGGMEFVTQMKYEVINVTDEEAEIKTTMLDKDGKEMGVPASTAKISFRVPKAAGTSDPKVETPKTSEETIKVAAGEFECIKVEMEMAGNKTTSWTSKKYTGLCVKSVTTGQAESVMELVEFKD